LLHWTARKHELTNKKGERDRRAMRILELKTIHV